MQANIISIAGTSIRQDKDGRYCLNDLHRASGGEGRHRPSLWMANRQTTELIRAIEAEAGIPASATLKGGAETGTYVAKELVYAYAMWISPAFHLKVIRAYDQLATAPAASALPNFTDPAAAAIAWAEQYRARQSLEAQNEAQAQQLAIVAPKAAALDVIADAEGSFCLTDASKHFSMPPRKFTQALAEMDWIYRRSGSTAWYGKAYRMASGDLDQIVRSGAREDGTEWVSTQCRITAKGMTTLAKLFASKAAA